MFKNLFRFQKERPTESFLISQTKLYCNFCHVTPMQFSASEMWNGSNGKQGEILQPTQIPVKQSTNSHYVAETVTTPNLGKYQGPKSICCATWLWHTSTSTTFTKIMGTKLVKINPGMVLYAMTKIISHINYFMIAFQHKKSTYFRAKFLCLGN